MTHSETIMEVIRFIRYVRVRSWSPLLVLASDEAYCRVADAIDARASDMDRPIPLPRLRIGGRDVVRFASVFGLADAILRHPYPAGFVVLIVDGEQPRIDWVSRFLGRKIPVVMVPEFNQGAA